MSDPLPPYTEATGVQARPHECGAAGCLEPATVAFRIGFDRHAWQEWRYRCERHARGIRHGRRQFVLERARIPRSAPLGSLHSPQEGEHA